MSMKCVYIKREFKNNDTAVTIQLKTQVCIKRLHENRYLVETMIGWGEISGGRGGSLLEGFFLLGAGFFLANGGITQPKHYANPT